MTLHDDRSLRSIELPNDLIDEAPSPEVGAFLARVRAAFEQQVPEPVAADHLASIIAEVRRDPVVVPIERPRAHRRVRVALVAAALLVAFGMLTGLAAAGVITLPEPVRSIFGTTEPDGGAPASDGETTVSDRSAPSPDPTPRASDAPRATPSATPGPPNWANHPGDGGDAPDRRSGDAPDRRTGDRPDAPGGDDRCEIDVAGLGCAP